MAALASTLVARDIHQHWFLRPSADRPGSGAGGARCLTPVPLGFRLAQHVSVALSPGQLIAVTGPTNSGKSTLLYCLAGLEVADAGTILVEGKDLSHATSQVRARV